MVQISKKELETMANSLAYVKNIIQGGIKGTAHPIHYQTALGQVDSCLQIILNGLRKEGAA